MSQEMRTVLTSCGLMVDEHGAAAARPNHMEITGPFAPRRTGGEDKN